MNRQSTTLLHLVAFMALISLSVFLLASKLPAVYRLFLMSVCFLVTAWALIKLKHALKALEVERGHDALTGLYNRRRTEEMITEYIARQNRQQWCNGLLMLDIDNFKAINDEFGHATGDEVLRAVGHTIHETIRKNDIAARWGGEEFLVILENVNVETLHEKAELIRSQINTIVLPNGDYASASVGALLWSQAIPRNDVMIAADNLLYQSKKTGKNRVSYCGSTCNKLTLADA